MSQDTVRRRDQFSPLLDVAQQIGQLWWVPLAAGLVSIGLGLTILAADWTVAALAVITALVFIVRGIALGLSPAYAGRTAGEHVVAGLAGVIAGIVLIAWPGPTLLVLAFFAGAWLTVSGCFHIIATFARRHELPHWGFTFAIGVIEVLLGVWAMRRPEVTLALLTTVIGLWAVLTGVIYCVLAFEVGRAGRPVPTAARGKGRGAA